MASVYVSSEEDGLGWREMGMDEESEGEMGGEE